MGDTRNAYRILVGKPEGKRPLGRPRRRWVDSIKMDLIGWDVMDWFDRPVEGSFEHAANKGPNITCECAPFLHGILVLSVPTGFTQSLQTACYRIIHQSTHEPYDVVYYDIEGLRSTYTGSGTHRTSYPMVFGVGIWTVVEKHQYVVLLTNATYELAAWVLIVAGCLVFLVTVIGCLGVLQNNRFFILVPHCGLGVDSASNRNENEESRLYSTLKVETVCSFETLIGSQRAARRYIQEAFEIPPNEEGKASIVITLPHRAGCRSGTLLGEVTVRPGRAIAQAVSRRLPTAAARVRTQYTFALLLVFLLEAMVGVMSFLYEPHVEEELRLNLNSTFVENYKMDDSKTSAIDLMQIEYKCCGANQFEDWRYSRWQKENLSEGLKVPNSCCKTITPQCGKSDHPSNIYYTGCRHRLADEIRDHLIILSAVGLGICVLQIFGMIFSCCLYIKLKDVVN
ncbi:hypothetical protein B7P43_G09478 [Cryptotermes secundus]|uniref:Tetraspanin n=1 Tax=Cryptotermes secundus TaxID=105785 RepID=A0A2J7R2N5_9NEOP|nr:hypothetical protein B7P43_G09478 [Cryptotermes secundus]